VKQLCFTKKRQKHTEDMSTGTLLSRTTQKLSVAFNNPYHQRGGERGGLLPSSSSSSSQSSARKSTWCSSKKLASSSTCYYPLVRRNVVIGCASSSSSSSKNSQSTRKILRQKRSHNQRTTKRGEMNACQMGKKGGAFLKEFAPEPTEEEKKKKEEREKAEELARTGGFPELLKNSNDEVFNVNVMVKNKGFGVLWNGIGTLTIPDTGAKENSVNLARVVCAQRKALLLSNCQRLYPKMQKFPMEWAVQPFDDPYADPLDLDMILDGEYVTEMVPGNFQFLKKGRAVGPGA